MVCRIRRIIKDGAWHCLPFIPRLKIVVCRVSIASETSSPRLTSEWYQLRSSKSVRLGKRKLCSAAIRPGLCLPTVSMIFRLKFHSARRVHHSGWHLEFRLSIALQGLLGHLQECFLHRGALHGAGFVEEHVVVFSGPLFAALTRHLPL